MPGLLRWPEDASPAMQTADTRVSEADLSRLLSLADEAHRLRAVARAVDSVLDDIDHRLKHSPTNAYAMRLSTGLAVTGRICVPAFGVRSLGISPTLAYLFVVFAGLLA